MAKKVVVDFTARDGVSKVADNIGRKISGLSGLASGLKGALVAGIGGTTLAAVVNHAAEFAKNLEDASKKLHLTVQETYDLKDAAQAAGVQFETMFKVRSKSEQFLQDVVDNKGDAAALASKFGITGQERWNDAIKKMMAGGANRNEFSSVVGPGAANWMSNKANQKAFMEGSDVSVNADAIHTMANFKLELENLIDAIEVGVIPALAGMVDWINKTYTRPLAANERAQEAASAAAAKKAKELGIEEGGWWKGVFNQFWNSTNQGERDFGGNRVRYEVGKYGGNAEVGQAAEDAYYSSYVNNLESLEDRAANRRKAFHEQERTAKIQEERTATPTKVSGDLGSNQFLKIGGLLGTDIGYRLERLQQQSNNYLERIANAVEGNDLPSIDDGPVNYGNAQ